MKQPEITQLSRETIDYFAQNKPSLVAKDLMAFGISSHDVYSTLLGRGVFKWLSVREDLIRLKNVWKHEIARLESLATFAENEELTAIRARIRGVSMCRDAVRSLCHSSRWRVPKRDKKAAQWMVQTFPKNKPEALSKELSCLLRNRGREK